MRTYILTEKERQVLKAFIESGLKLNGFAVLTLRLRKAHPILESDLKLIRSTLEKLSE